MNRTIPHSLRFHVQANFEGWAAGIAAAGVAVSAGSAIASNVNSSNAASAQQDLLSAEGKKPKIVAANFEDPSKAFDAYNTEVSQQYPGLARDVANFNATDNANYQAQLAKTSPTLMANIAQQGKVAGQELRGNIPSDVASQVTRSDAYQSLLNGGNVNSGASHALTARDLGLTSLNLQQQGSSMLGANITNTKAVNPYQATADSLLMTPTQLLSRDDSNAAYANAVLNANNNIQYSNGLAQTAAAGYNPAMAGISSGLGAVGGVVNSAGSLYRAANTGGGSSAGGGYMSQGSDAYDTNSIYATNGGYYNPIADTANYSEDGTYIGPAVYGPTGTYGGS